MGDVNDDINNINAQIAGSGLSMDKISSGTQLGAAFGLQMDNHFSVGLGFERLTAKSDVSDQSASIKYDFPANNVQFFGRYYFAGTAKARAFVEGAVGRASEAGKVSASVSGAGAVSGDVKGSGFSASAEIGGEMWSAPQLAFAGSIGYRHASLGNITVMGNDVHSALGGDYTIDFSGIFIRAGVVFALTP